MGCMIVSMHESIYNAYITIKAARGMTKRIFKKIAPGRWIEASSNKRGQYSRPLLPSFTQQVRQPSAVIGSDFQGPSACTCGRDKEEINYRSSF
jgi:hypothetical protein